MAILRARRAARRLPDWAPDWEREREPAYAEAVRRMRTETMVEMLLELDRTLTGAQRRAAVARLRAWAADFEMLMRR